ncbi:MAG: PmeII family type II restriction endonuclease [Synechococcales bacterium]|nr:PmeII family type II restriction endonuclease [Synechococcales bacterium]
MPPIEQRVIVRYVEENIPQFHESRINGLKNLKLQKILKRKNPYLFKAKNINTAGDFVKGLLDAHLSSSEEGLFGGFLEGLAVFICSQTFNGRKSSAEGIDLEFEREGVRYLVSIKSGPNWGNSSQIRRMIDNFNKAKKILGTNTSLVNVVAINGCCYGKDNRPDKGTYLKLCGQRFWEFISGDEALYTEIIEPLGYRAKENNENFEQEYSKVINRFTREFMQDFCNLEGEIVWSEIVKLNSASEG